MRAILTYHSIDDSGSPISVSPAVFDRHLEWFRRGAIPVVPLADLCTGDFATPAVAITFDDALQTVADNALPRLAEAGLTATIFVPTGHVGGDNRWRGDTPAGIPVLPVMTWERLGEAVKTGMTIGAHTRSHPWLPDCDDDALESELVGARQDIECHLGITPGEVAYPYGAVDTRVLAVAAQNYSLGLTTSLRWLDRRDDPHSLPRLDAWYFRDPRWFSRWGSSVLKSYLALRHAGRQLRGALG